ncbi:MAG TPA: hypothetical protein VL360_09335 [Gammaproteobacteria bacterium]|nr:hypothetical protein [Gammaproteobacteria bacterium]
MLRLWHYFGGSDRELTRFDATEEVKPIKKLLKELRGKETELRRAKSAKGAGSVDFEKHTVISRLLQELDHEIQGFNDQPEREVEEDRVNDLINLVGAMEGIVKRTIQRNEETLRKFRNSQHDIVVNTVDWGLFAGSMSALYMMPGGLIIKGTAYFFGFRDLQKYIMEQTGLTEDETRSMMILRVLQSTLHKSYLNLRSMIHPEYVNIEVVQEAPRRQRNEDGDLQSGLLFLMNPATQHYIDSMYDKPRNTHIVEEMQLTPEEDERLLEWICPISQSVMDVPVRVGENYFDLEWLLQLPIDREGQRSNPLTRDKFYARDIQPGRDGYNKIQEIISAIKAERQNPAPRP